MKKLRRRVALQFYDNEMELLEKDAKAMGISLALYVRSLTLENYASKVRSGNRSVKLTSFADLEEMLTAPAAR